jgi:hypothetical protein
MAKKTYFYKFMIKTSEKIPKIAIDGIKEAIFLYLGDIPRANIHGGIANNNGYHKFGVENENKAQQIKC